MILLHPPLVAEPGHKDGTAAHNRSKQMRDPRPFIVTKNGQFLFIVHCYSARQARELVAARLADTTGVLIVAPRKGSPR